MISHAPKGYECPICKGINGIESDERLPEVQTEETKRKPVVLMKQADFVYRDNLASAFINSFWIPTCEGHVIVVTNEHFENLYDMPAEIGHRVFDVSKKIAIAMKSAYGCDGITLRQNNEPASNQHAFHYHLHIFPRYDGDSFNINLTKKSVLSDPKKRVGYAKKMKDILRSN